MRMWSWLSVCIFLGITSMHDVSAQTCLCAQGLCASGWVQYKSACYKAVRQRYTWTEAEMSCQTFSPTSHLASVHSVEENDFIFHLMGKPVDYNKGEAYWIGAHDTFKEGTFVWTDGSRFDFNAFPSEQPDGLGGENYLGSWFLRNGKISWNDYRNSWKLLSVCKYYLGNRNYYDSEKMDGETFILFFYVASIVLNMIQNFTPEDAFLVRRYERHTFTRYRRLISTLEDYSVKLCFSIATF